MRTRPIEEMVTINTVRPSYSERPHVTYMDAHDLELCTAALVVLPLKDGVVLPLQEGGKLYANDGCFFYEGQVGIHYFVEEYPNDLTIKFYAELNPGYDAAMRSLLGDELYEQVKKGSIRLIDPEDAAAIIARIVEACAII